VRIPLAADGAAAEPERELEAPAAHGMRGKSILVIDDEHDVADLTANLLQRLGYQVWASYSGKSGIEMALQHRPDVALVDIAMPDVDGYDVARALRRSLPEILLIAITGLVQESSRQRSREAGFDYHLAKPASINQIDELIVQHFQQREAQK
jgi:CheY-like chemotaxis protein